MKIKERLGILIILFLIPIGFAKAEPYLGLNIGGSLVSINKELSFVGTNANASGSYTGFRGQLFLGLNFFLFCDNIFFHDLTKNCNPLQNLFFSLEGDINYNSGHSANNVNSSILSIDDSAQLNYGYDIFVLAKYHFSPDLIWFFGPGISWGKLNANSTVLTDRNLGISGGTNAWITGWSIKAGLQIPFTRCIDLIATYEYSNFGDHTWSRYGTLAEVNVATKYKATVNSLTVGIVLKDFLNREPINNPNVNNYPPPPPVTLQNSNNIPHTADPPPTLPPKNFAEEFKQEVPDTYYNESEQETSANDFEADLRNDFAAY